MINISADRAIIAVATAGPWGNCNGHSNVIFGPEYPVANVTAREISVANANATFIAAARTGWPAALDEVERLQAENAALREAQRWIAVGAKLPKWSNYVMAVWNSEGVAWVGEAFYNATTKLFETSFDQSTDHAITHWQPLPTAPQEGE